MEWNDNLNNLNYLLAGMVPFKQEAYEVAVKAGLSVGNISFAEKANTNWFFILQQAIHENKLDDLLNAVETIFGESPQFDLAKQSALYGYLDPEQGAQISDWEKDEQNDAVLEKIIGRDSTLLPISYFEKGLEVSKAVARIITPQGIGSGFLIRDNLLLTNCHVIPTADVAVKTHVEFNFQETATGLSAESVKYQCNPEKLFHSHSDHDWTLVALKGEPNQTWGQIKIARQFIQKNDRVSIIQHPGGGPKQIAIHHNYVRYVDERIVQYLTDTLNGSSGAPVFNNDWQLVAMHRAGGYIREPNSKRILFRNEGIHINCIMDGLVNTGFTTV